jgi:hypothetical protein
MPIFYHGTTARRARLIQANGFKPRPPSKRVWFARHRSVAERRAHHKASASASDRPLVLTCEIDIDALIRYAGGGRVFHSRGVLAVRGPIPASVLRDDPRDGRRFPTPLDLTERSEPEALARWINRLLGLKPHKGVSRKHPGLLRLSRWMKNRAAQNSDGEISGAEVAEVAAYWLPDFFEGVSVETSLMRILRYRGSAAGDLSTLVPHVGDADAEIDVDIDAGSEIEIEALACLAADKPRRRVRGLRLLASIEAPADLVEWCILLVDDDDIDVSVAALEMLASKCEDVNPFLVEDLAADEDRRLRAAALEVLAVHDEAGVHRWLWAGLTDPEVHVRMRLARHLDRLDPGQYPDVFHTALTDPNPEIVRIARRRSEGRGVGVPSW